MTNFDNGDSEKVCRDDTEKGGPALIALRGRNVWKGV